ncbi:hypothetical protein BH09GEM1_BH09GEM1_37730 [soil metagenome]
MTQTARHRERRTDDERAHELELMERGITRARWRLLCETLIGCLTCCGVGLFLVGWAVHTTNAVWGGISFWSGLLIGDVGMIALLMRHYQRSEGEG